MVTVVILLYLIFVSLFLFTKKQKINKKLKNNKLRVKGCKPMHYYFCTPLNKKYKLFCLLQRKLFTFKSESLYNKFVMPLNNIGVDCYKSIYKLELYKNFNWQYAKEELEILNNFSCFGLDFYTFVFVDKEENINKVKLFLNNIGYNKNIFVYYCVDVCYKLLASINYFDVNIKNKLSYNINSKYFTTQPKVTKKLENANNLNDGFSFKLNNKIIGVDFDFCLNHLAFDSEVENCQINLTKVFNYNAQFEVYNLKLKNNSGKNKKIEFYFFNSFKNTKGNMLNVFNISYNKIYFENKNSGKFVMFSSFFKTKVISECGVYLLKKIAIKNGEELNMFFVQYYNKNNLKTTLVDLKSMFYNTLEMNKNLLKIKVLSYNKNLNLLINEVLPQKIIEQQLRCPNKISIDFKSLLNLQYNENMVQKSLILVPMGSFNLIRDNYFKYYFNLLFFYFGVWKTGNNNIVLNQDKSLILQDSKVVFNVNNKAFCVQNKKVNLNNEVKIDNVAYSNLKFLNCTNLLENGKNGLEISF